MEIPSQSVMCSYVIGSFFEYIRFTWQRHRTLRSLFCSDRFKANFFVSWLQQHTLKYLHVSIHQDHKVSSDSEPAYLPLLGVYKPAHMVYSFGLRFRNAGATVRSGLHIEPQPWWYLVYRPDYSRLLQQRSPLQQPGYVLCLCVQFWPEDFGAPSLTTTNFHHQRLNVCEYHLSRSGLAKKPRDDPKVDICKLWWSTVIHARHLVCQEHATVTTISQCNSELGPHVSEPLALQWFTGRGRADR